LKSAFIINIILSVRAKVRALFAEKKVRFARAEQLWVKVLGMKSPPQAPS